MNTKKIYDKYQNKHKNYIVLLEIDNVCIAYGNTARYVAEMLSLPLETKTIDNEQFDMIKFDEDRLCKYAYILTRIKNQKVMLCQ